MNTSESERIIHSISSGEAAQKLNAFYELLCFYNEKYNLTRITEKRECLIKHFFDSVCAEEYFPHGARAAEVGSGPGFPSVPLKIVRDDLHFTLIESVGKKCSFLKEAVKELSLSNVEIVNCRAEDLGKDKNFRERFDCCCARAVARLNTLAEYCVPFVRVGGRFIAYKGEGREELAEANSAFDILGVKTIACDEYELPEEMGKRTLIVAEKIKNTPQQYPRGKGKERSKPL